MSKLKIFFIAVTILMFQLIHANDYTAASVQKYRSNDASIKIYKYSLYEEVHYDFSILDYPDVIDGMSGADKIKIIPLAKEFPFLVIEILYFNEGARYSLYNTKGDVSVVAKWLHIIKKRGTDKLFYKNNSEYFMNIITTKGVPIAKCNSCQTYNVETYKITKDGLKLARTVSLESYQNSTMTSSRVGF